MKNRKQRIKLHAYKHAHTVTASVTSFKTSDALRVSNIRHLRLAKFSLEKRKNVAFCFSNTVIIIRVILLYSELRKKFFSFGKLSNAQLHNYFSFLHFLLDSIPISCLDIARMVSTETSRTIVGIIG
jgi:hypothetical protein